MFKSRCAHSIFAIFVLFSVNLVLAADGPADKTKQQINDSDKIQSRDMDQTVYGWQLMSQEERIEHRKTMRSLKSSEAREAYRRDHHKQMQERAKKMGTNLPDIPIPRGQGLGSRGDKAAGGGRGNN